MELFGYIRFVLAYFVLLSHMGYNFFGKNIGVFAVVIFYIIAGLVTSKLLIKVSPYNIRYFIVDRFLRIYPTFFIISIFTLVFLMLTKYSGFVFDWLKVILNFAIVPLNYFHFFDLSLIQAPAGLNFLLPPAWSLGAEIQAYVVLAIGIFYKKFGIIAAFLSLGIFILANLNIINPDIFGYRLVCGVFFTFYTGLLIYKRKFKLVAVFFITILILFLYFLISGKIYMFALETTFGYLVGVFIISTHERFKVNLPFNSLFGSLSYSLFLSHFLAIWISEYIFDKISLVVVTLISLALSLFLYFICEKPMTFYRLKKR